LSEITSQLVAEHNLTAEEYERILEILGREPTIAELGIFSVMWSEHCSYKSSRMHLKRLPTKGPAVVQGPGENAGIVDIGNGWVCAFKIESHNHPSFVEPFQGAATGVGGILRDIFTMGARPIAVMDSLRFGPVREPVRRSAQRKSGDTARNRRILRGVVSGIAFYGNCFGVPTVGGETVFDPCYERNPLVNVFALGIARKDQIFYAKAAGPGNPVIYVGAKTGRDGIHGASLLASSEFSGADGQQKRPNVQVGDPFLEKLLLEACLEAMQTGAVLSIQDMGAAGLTCSTCEMGGRGGVGIEIELDRVPQRETGMSPYEIMLSESQERMLLVAERGREHEVARVFAKWDLDAVEIGSVIVKPVLRVKQHGEVVAEIPNHALTEEAPVYDRPQTMSRRPVLLEPSAPLPPRSGAELAEDLLALLESPALASKRWIFEQYDSMVRTNTVIGPGGDAAVLRLKETGQGLAMAVDGNGRYCFLSARRGGQLAVAEAARNVSVTGAEPLGATNCLNFGNPEKPTVMSQFREVIEGIAEACETLAIPITGGNVSFYNETEGDSIHPTPVIGVVGLLQNAERHAKPWFQGAGSSIVLLGGGIPYAPSETSVTFGSSQYAETVLGELWGLPPQIDLEHEQRVQACCRRLIAENLAESAHDVSDGGLAVTLAECCLGRGVGAAVEMPPAADPRAWLFAEDPSRIVISVAPGQLADAKRIAAQYNVTAEVIGQTGGTADGAAGGTTLHVSQKGSLLFEVPIATLRIPYETGFEREIESGGE
jgi:phosphoribosylformylglycinamidine synthase